MTPIEISKCKYEVININQVFQVIFATDNARVLTGIFWVVSDEGKSIKEAWIQDIEMAYDLKHMLRDINNAINLLDTVAQGLVQTIEGRDIILVDDIQEYLDAVAGGKLIAVSPEYFGVHVYE